MSVDPYHTLGVSKNATQAEIKAAYRKLAKKLHPDLNPGKKDIEAQFKEINNAYDKIETPEARAKFDLGEAEEKQNHNQQRNSGDPFYYYQTQSPGSRYSQDSDAFSDFFRQQGFQKPEKAQDHHYSLEVDFKTGVLGGQREITLPNGKKLMVKIPPGIKSGSKLRLADQGEIDTKGIKNGDAYIEINISPSLVFKRVENDLQMNLPLSLSEVILGGEVQVETIDGPVTLNIPKGLSSGAKLRMKAKGVPHKNGRGDQFAIVTIVMPTHIDSDLENFIKEWSKNKSYNPREAKEKSK